MTDMKGDAQFAVCISNKGYAASLEVRKIYRLIPDEPGRSTVWFGWWMRWVRVIYTPKSISLRDGLVKVVASALPNRNQASAWPLGGQNVVSN